MSKQLNTRSKRAAALTPWIGRLAALLALTGAAQAHAAITHTGSVDPSPPSTSTSSDDLSIGYNSPGTVTIDGGSALACDEAIVGYNYTGELTITGTGSRLGGGSGFYVGYDGQGKASILGGAVLTNTDEAIIGWDAPGEVTVSGKKSNWKNTGELYVGYDIPGTLSVLDGATVSSTDSYIGYDGNGTVTVSGAGSTWTAFGSEAVVGYDGSEWGDLTISSGGTIRAPGEFYLSYYADAFTTFGIGDDGTGTTASGLIDVGDLIVGDYANSVFDLEVDGSGSLSPGDRFTLIDYGTFNGTLFVYRDATNALVPLADDSMFTTSTGEVFLIDYNTDLGGGDMAMTATFGPGALAVVPEPTTFLIWSLGLLGLAWCARRRR